MRRMSGAQWGSMGYDPDAAEQKNTGDFRAPGDAAEWRQVPLSA